MRAFTREDDGGTYSGPRGSGSWPHLRSAASSACARVRARADSTRRGTSVSGGGGHARRRARREWHAAREETHLQPRGRDDRDRPCQSLQQLGRGRGYPHDQVGHALRDGADDLRPHALGHARDERLRLRIHVRAAHAHRPPVQAEAAVADADDIS